MHWVNINVVEAPGCGENQMMPSSMAVRPTSGWPQRALRRAVKRVAPLLGLALRLSGRKAGVVIVYHRVRDLTEGTRDEVVPSVSPRLLAAQLGHLKSRYCVVPASELHHATKRRRRGTRFPVAVTFDDDLPTHNSVARPVLERLGIPAAFFLCGASLREPSAFWWERLEFAAAAEGGVPPQARLLLAHLALPGADDRSELAEVAAAVEGLPAADRQALAAALHAGPVPGAGMSADDVRALAASGFEIGFHTLRHEPLSQLDDGSLRRAMTDGRDRLATVAGRELRTIAYPHGKADARVAGAARAAGYAFGFTGRGEAVIPDSDPLLLGRLQPSSESAGHFALQVARALMGRRRPDA